MKQARWYPTALTLGNGEVLSIGGSNGDARGNIFKPEVYNPTTGNWRTLSNVDYEGILVTPDKSIILDDTYPFMVCIVQSYYQLESMVPVLILTFLSSLLFILKKLNWSGVGERW